MFRCQSISRSFFKSALQVSFCFSRLVVILPFEQFHLFLLCESDMEKRPCGQFMQKSILQPSEGSFFSWNLKNNAMRSLNSDMLPCVCECVCVSTVHVLYCLG